MPKDFPLLFLQVMKKQESEKAFDILVFSCSTHCYFTYNGPVCTTYCFGNYLPFKILLFDSVSEKLIMPKDHWLLIASLYRLLFTNLQIVHYKLFMNRGNGLKRIVRASFTAGSLSISTLITFFPLIE